MCQTFGLDIYIGCLPLRRRATSAEDVPAYPGETYKAMLLAQNICRGVLRNTDTPASFNCLDSLLSSFLIHRPGTLNPCIYIRATVMPLLQMFCQTDMPASANEQKRKQYCCRYIYRPHRAPLVSQLADFCNVMSLFLCPVAPLSLQERKKKKREGERTGQDMPLGRNYLIPCNTFGAVSTCPHLITEMDVATRHTYIRLRSTIQVKRSLKRGRRSPPPYIYGAASA